MSKFCLIENLQLENHILLKNSKQFIELQV